MREKNIRSDIVTAAGWLFGWLGRGWLMLAAGWLRPLAGSWLLENDGGIVCVFFHHEQQATQHFPQENNKANTIVRIYYCYII